MPFLYQKGFPLSTLSSEVESLNNLLFHLERSDTEYLNSYAVAKIISVFVLNSPAGGVKAI